MIDYRLRTFLTLCECMNYRRAAEILSMTQPAVTQHIHYLENYYNCKLFEYDRRKLTMTRQAEILLGYARNIEYQEQTLQTKMNEEPRQKLYIGATKTIGEYVIGGHLAAYIKAADKEISVTVANTELLLKKLDRGELDFALIEGEFNRKKYASRLYQQEEFVGICSAAHPFAGKTVELKECIKEKLLLREPGSGTRRILETLLTYKNSSIDDFTDIVTANHTGLITNLIEQNCGITFAYKAVADGSPQLAVFRLKDAELVHDYSVVYLDNSYAAALADEFMRVQIKSEEDARKVESTKKNPSKMTKSASLRKKIASSNEKGDQLTLFDIDVK